MENGLSDTQGSPLKKKHHVHRPLFNQEIWKLLDFKSPHGQVFYIRLYPIG